MGAQCCSDVNQGQESQAGRKSDRKRQINFAAVDVVHELELLEDEVEARMGAEDPDLDALRQKAKDREESCQKTGMRRSQHRKGTGAPSELQRADECPKTGMRRSQTRKSTEAPSGLGTFKGMSMVGISDDVSESDEDTAAPVRKRCQGRKATGAPTDLGRARSPVVRISHEAESEAPSGRKRCQARKGTGFVKAFDVPDDASELSTDTSNHTDSETQQDDAQRDFVHCWSHRSHIWNHAPVALAVRV